ncbi:MAG: hypothetical protein JO101_10795 [Candidatus Eremiobacteraeota bacterium]|nr:hypothetical protein [Candidatus Eremiobacteraeota bacterium]
MGRIVKNAPASNERYIVAPPAGGGNGRAHLFDEAQLGGFEQSGAFGDFGNNSPATVAVISSGSSSFEVAEPQIDWEELRSQTEALVEAAASEGEAILREAHDRAAAILEATRGSAGDVTARAQEGGHQAGYAAGTDAAQAEMDSMLSTMRGLIEMARVERHKIIESAEPEIVRLAMGIAEQILHKQVDYDRSVVVEMVKAAIGRLVDRESITVRVNPVDLARMQQHRDEVLALGETKHVRVIEDRRVDPGGVIVETDSGTLDARIKTQVEEARRALNIVDERVVVPAADTSLAS